MSNKETNYFNTIGSFAYNSKKKPENINNQIAYMLNRTQAMFEYSGLPDSIPQDMLELQLQTNGFAGFVKNGDELVAVGGGLGGKPDGYYRPTKFIVANPGFNLYKEFSIDEDCVIVKNDTLLKGLLPIYSKWATLLVENELSIALATINSRIISLISAGTDAAKKSAEKYIQDVFKGELSIIWDAAAMETIKTQPYATAQQATVIKGLIELEQYLKAAGFQDVGINANFNMKREAINESEAALNDDALLPFVDDMLRCRKVGLEKVNVMFGTNIQVKLASSWEDIQEAEEKLDDPEPEEELEPDKEESTEEEEVKEDEDL